MIKVINWEHFNQDMWVINDPLAQTQTPVYIVYICVYMYRRTPRVKILIITGRYCG